MSNELQNIQMAFVCRENWEEMAAQDGGRFCKACNKKVYDFTNAKVEDFLQILAENDNHICGRFRKEQTTPLPTPAWKKYISAALVLVGIHIFNSHAQAQNKPVPNSTNTSANDDIFGRPLMQVDAEFPGGINKLLKFIEDHIQYQQGMLAGKVFTTFTVGKDGTISNIKILRGLSPLNDKEAVRVIKLMPAWHPSIQANRNVAQQYTLPVTFK